MSLVEFFSFLGFSSESSAAAAAISKENDIISVDHLLSCSEEDLAQMGLSVGVKRKILSYKQSAVSLDTFLEPNAAVFDKPKIIGIQKELQSNLLPIDAEITKLKQTLNKLEQYKNYLSNGIQSITEFLSLIETIQTNPFQTPLISTHDNRNELTPQEESNIRIIMRFYSTISSHSTNRELVLQCGNSLLTNIIKPSKLASEIFLEECPRKVIERSLLQCCDREMRVCFRNVLWGALKNVIPTSYSFRDESTDSPTSGEPETEEIPAKEFEWIRIMNDLFELMNLLPFHWKNFSEFFQLFRLFANETNHQDFLYRKNFLGKISNLILRGTVDTSIIAPEMRDNTKDLPDFSAAVDVICTIIRLSDGHTGNPYALDGKKISINEQSIAFVFSKNFLRKITFDPKEKLDNLGQLFCFLSYENRAHSQSLESFMREMTNDCEHYQIPDCFALIDPMIGMKDSLQAARVEYFLYHIIRILNKFRKYPKFTCGMITHSNRLYNKYNVCKLWLDAHPEDWSWAFDWMQKRGFLIERPN